MCVNHRNKICLEGTWEGYLAYHCCMTIQTTLESYVFKFTTFPMKTCGLIFSFLHNASHIWGTDQFGNDGGDWLMRATGWLFFEGTYRATPLLV